MTESNGSNDPWGSYIAGVKKREREGVIEKARSFDSVLLLTHSIQLFEDEDLKPVVPKESTRDCLILACDTGVRCIVLEECAEHIAFSQLIAEQPHILERDVKYLTGLEGQETSGHLSNLGGLERVPYSRFRADLDSLKILRSNMTEEELNLNASKLEHSKRGSDRDGMELIDFDSALSSFMEDDSETVEPEQEVES
nr:MAG: hypothetical protein 3 [Guangxi cystovirus 6]